MYEDLWKIIEEHERYGWTGVVLDTAKTKELLNQVATLTERMERVKALADRAWHALLDHDVQDTAECVRGIRDA